MFPAGGRCFFFAPIRHCQRSFPEQAQRRFPPAGARLLSRSLKGKLVSQGIPQKYGSAVRRRPLSHSAATGGARGAFGGKEIHQF